MSDINVSRAHGMTKDEALGKLKTLADSLRSRYGIGIDFKGDVANVKGKGVSGDARVTDTHVSLNLKLGFAARLIAGKIKAGVDKQLDEHFPA